MLHVQCIYMRLHMYYIDMHDPLRCHAVLSYIPIARVVHENQYHFSICVSQFISLIFLTSNLSNRRISIPTVAKCNAMHLYPYGYDTTAYQYIPINTATRRSDQRKKVSWTDAGTRRRFKEYLPHPRGWVEGFFV